MDYSATKLLINSVLFTSNKLVKLTITYGFFLDARLPCGGCLFLPALKTLSLVSDSFDMIKFFIHGCPKLEELFVCILFRLYSHKPKTPSFDDSNYGNRVVFDSLVKARLDIQASEMEI